MIGVQYEQQIEGLGCDRINLVGLSRHREQHVQQVFAVFEVVLRVHERLANVQFVCRRRNCREFRENAVREDVAVHRVTRIHLAVVVSRHGTHDRRQHGHRVRIVAKALEEIQHALVEHRVRANHMIELLEFRRGGQFTVQQQIRHLDEAGVRRELFDRVPPVHQDAFFTVDKGYVGPTASGGDISRIESEDSHVAIQARDVDDIWSGRSGVNRQFHFRAAGAHQAISFLGRHFPRLFFLRSVEHSKTPLIQRIRFSGLG